MNKHYCSHCDNRECLVEARKIEKYKGLTVSVIE